MDHDEIRRWVEARGGYPARVKGTGRPGDAGLLRIDYPGFRGEERLERIGWADWFDAFEENNLALVRSTEPRNRFSKLVSRDTVGVPRTRRPAGRRAGRVASAGRGGATKRTAAKKLTKKRATARPAAPKRAAPKKTRTGRTASKKRTTRGSARISRRGA